MARTSTNQRINRRLLPLYIAAFFQSFVLWYNIEKLFMRSIGFNNSVIGIMVAVYSLVMLVVETPSGILADRWSRKGVLILASICIALSSLLGGLSHGIPLYILCAVLWGIFFACYSGMYESIVYDTLVEEAPKKPLYELYYGRIQLLDSTSLVLSSLAGGVLAATTSLRMTYFVTIPIMLIPVWALLRFNEPTLHRQHAIIPLWQQIGDTFRAVTRSRAILPVVCVLILESTLAYCIYEFAQLWLLALHTPVRYFGLANAILLSSLGIGGWAASKLSFNRFRRMAMALIFLLAGSFGLVFFRNTAAIVISELVITAVLSVVHIIFSRILHDNLPASIRAGAASATSTFGRFAIIPAALIIGYLSQQYSIYLAANLLVGIAVLVCGFIIFVARRNNYRGLES